jgi:integrase
MVVLLMTGLRCGELCALRWSDVDLHPTAPDVSHWMPSLHVRRSFYWRHGDPVFRAHPKTESSDRRVFLPPQAVEALTLWRVAQREQRLVAGAAWQTAWVGMGARHQGETISFGSGADGLICTDALGLPWANQIIMRLHRRIARLADVPLIRPHDLRHSCSTLLQEAGLSVKVVSVMLGHARVETTSKIYTHVTAAMLMDAATTLSQLLAPSSPSPASTGERTP